MTSAGGHAKTLMFVQINPDVSSYSETLSTLKFAERVSGVELGAAKANKEGKDIRELMEQVKVFFTHFILVHSRAIDMDYQGLFYIPHHISSAQNNHETVGDLLLHEMHLQFLSFLEVKANLHIKFFSASCHIILYLIFLTPYSSHCSNIKLQRKMRRSINFSYSSLKLQGPGLQSLLIPH
jgi:hypothetical protein